MSSLMWERLDFAILLTDHLQILKSCSLCSYPKIFQSFFWLEFEIKDLFIDFFYFEGILIPASIFIFIPLRKSLSFLALFRLNCIV